LSTFPLSVPTSPICLFFALCPFFPFMISLCFSFKVSFRSSLFSFFYLFGVVFFSFLSPLSLFLTFYSFFCFLVTSFFLYFFSPSSPLTPPSLSTFADFFKIFVPPPSPPSPCLPMSFFRFFVLGTLFEFVGNILMFFFLPFPLFFLANPAFFPLQWVAYDSTSTYCPSSSLCLGVIRFLFFPSFGAPPFLLFSADSFQSQRSLRSTIHFHTRPAPSPLACPLSSFSFPVEPSLPFPLIFPPIPYCLSQRGHLSCIPLIFFR